MNKNAFPFVAVEVMVIGLLIYFLFFTSGWISEIEQASTNQRVLEVAFQDEGVKKYVADKESYEIKIHPEVTFTCCNRSDPQKMPKVKKHLYTVMLDCEGFSLRVKQTDTQWTVGMALQDKQHPVVTRGIDREYCESWTYPAISIIQRPSPGVTYEMMFLVDLKNETVMGIMLPPHSTPPLPIRPK